MDLARRLTTRRSLMCSVSSKALLVLAALAAMVACSPEPEPVPQTLADSWTSDENPWGDVGDALAIDDVAVIDGPPADTPSEPDLPTDTEVAVPAVDRTNVLLIIVDDFGIDAFAPYAEAGDGRVYPTTPNLDALCSQGVRFTQAWSAPTCTPTRGTILTGRYGFRTGLLTAGGGNAIGASETTLPQLLTTHAPAYRHANIGKWHLGTPPALGGASAPNTMGWQHYAGSLSGALPDYSAWDRTVDGTTAATATYATTQNVDDALAFIAQGEAPWVLWLAFNAPHRPFHRPPDPLHSQLSLSGTESDIQQNPVPYYNAMVEALDTEVGRLLATVDRHKTVVLVVGDNGTPASVIAPPWSSQRAKDTLYQGGIHVPLCVSGPGVKAGTQEALVHTVDLFGTIAHLAGIAHEVVADTGVDSRSLLWLLGLEGASPSSRPWNLSESLDGRAIRDERYKLLEFADGDEALYDLLADPLETVDLSLMADTDSTLGTRREQLRQWLGGLTEATPP